MIKVVVFDFDGTLADTNTVKEECLHRTVAGLPDGPTLLETARQGGGDRYKVFAEIARRVWHGADPELIAGNARALVDGTREAGLANGCARFFEDAADAGEYARSAARPGDAILFKASRGVKIERALERFLADG